MPDSLTILQQRIKKLSAVSESGCWLWTGATKPNGYGNMSWNGKTIMARIIRMRTGAASWVTLIRPRKFCMLIDETAIYAASGTSSGGTGRSRGGTGYTPPACRQLANW